MTNTYKWLVRLITATSLFLFCMALSGCGLLKAVGAAGQANLDGTSPGGLSGKPPPYETVTDTAQLQEHARRLGLFAMFSQLSYLRHLPVPERERCNSFGPNHKVHPLEQIDPRQSQGQAGWAVWENELGCLSRDGLYLETYAYYAAPAAGQRHGSTTRAVIAIRGTENYRGQFLWDWWSNLAGPLFGLEPIEYRLARQHIDRIIDELRREKSDVEIYLTGHSLGGGIAQQSAYLNRVQGTYVFNTSPVTNWVSLELDPVLREQLRVRGDVDPNIVRATETGEFLSYVRRFSTMFTFTRNNRKDYLFSFIPANFIGSHSIAVMACNFAVLRANTPRPDLSRSEDFDYTPAMAREFFNYPGADPACPDSMFANGKRPELLSSL